MKYKDNIFATLKLLIVTTIFVEFSVLKMLISPSSLREYLCAIQSSEIYIEHIAISIVFLVGGALIILTKL
jgi:hypothetical protein